MIFKIIFNLKYKNINNTINDPNYVISHYKNWKSLWEKEGEVKLSIDQETDKKLLEILNNNFK